MNGTIYCLVDAGGTVHAKDDAEWYSEIAAADGLDEHTCQMYRFDLINRRLLTDRGLPGGDRAARTYLDRRVGTPDKLVQFAVEGHLPKPVLMSLVAPEKRKAYADACAIVEKKYTDECAAKNEPCLESGCAVKGEICLQPLLHAGIEYHKLCAGEWTGLFADPGNRIDAWRS